MIFSSDKIDNMLLYNSNTCLALVENIFKRHVKVKPQMCSIKQICFITCKNMYFTYFIYLNMFKLCALNMIMQT